MRPNPFDKTRGFTLIEIMIVVLIVAILTAIAIPSYQDYVIRSRITQAISGLSTRQTQMEQCFQDNHTYVDCAACAEVTEGDFKFACSDEMTATTFTLTATGQNPMSGFEYTVDQSDTKTSEISGGPSGWDATSSSCWIIGKGGTC
jgi:type IV pilus assembly protein PilE